MMGKPTMILAGVVGASLLCVGGWFVTGASGDNPWPDSGPVFGDGKDRYRSSTAADWVSNADHVVVATAVSEKDVPPAQIDIDRGEGLIGRSVEMRVDQVLWSREGAGHPAPQTYARQSTGWVFDDEPANRHEYALHGRPRIEPGHSYVIALHWEPARCSEGDEPDAAGWVGLGSGSTLPFDEGTLGKGEFEGTERPAPSPSAAARATTGDGAPVADLLTGQGADKIKELLATASPTSTPTTSSGAPSAGSSVPTTSGTC
ncbi:hypothetical protein [Streptomyces sp. NPDC005181]|uniref:hypothetical protein n=1 Tax=Streptomyces sp. NPDC005181 TaxID=3156869 RepID=UPI0033BCB12D